MNERCNYLLWKRFFNSLCAVFLAFILPVAVLTVVCLAPSPIRAADVSSLQQQEARINDCAMKIDSFERNRESGRQYSQKERQELLECIEIIKEAAKQPIKEPNTIFKAK